MERYAKFRPTAFDPAGYCLDDRQDWLVLGVAQTRDSDALSRSNFEQALEALGGESKTVEVHRFGHWGPGWFEIIIIDPSDNERVEIGADIERALADYPVLNDEDFSEKESEEANETWSNCYNWQERINYIRDNRSQFDFRNFTDLMRCVRGEYFGAHASELIG
jgi:hypothetical protein